MHHSVLASQIFVYFFFSDEEKWNVEKLTIQVWTDSEQLKRSLQENQVSQGETKDKKH